MNLRTSKNNTVTAILIHLFSPSVAMLTENTNVKIWLANSWQIQWQMRGDTGKCVEKLWAWNHRKTNLWPLRWLQWTGPAHSYCVTLYLIWIQITTFSELLFPDRKRRLIGDEFYKNCLDEEVRVKAEELIAVTTQNGSVVGKYLLRLVLFRDKQ